MSIDWITVAAQIINFLVLVWLLKRFLYRPILDGIDQREASIAARMSNAEEAESIARKAQTSHQAALDTLTEEKAAILETTRLEAKTEADTLRVQARDQLQAEQDGWHAKINDERAAYLADLRLTGAEAILTLTGKALKDLANVQLEDQIASKLESQLREHQDDLQAAKSSEEAVAISSFTLSEARRKSIREAFKGIVKDVPLTFKVDANESPGISLQVGGMRLGWTVEGYIDDLERTLHTRLEPQYTAEPDKAGAIQ